MQITKKNIVDLYGCFLLKLRIKPYSQPKICENITQKHYLTQTILISEKKNDPKFTNLTSINGITGENTLNSWKSIANIKPTKMQKQTEG